MLKINRLLSIIAILVSASFACQAMGGGSPEPAQAPSGGADETTDSPANPPNGSEGEFPMPSDASTVMDLDGTLNFQTDLSLAEAVAFYRAEFGAQGYTEREINTVVEEAVFSLVFDGHASGRAIVVQGVDLGDNTNINIRFEDV